MRLWTNVHEWQMRRSDLKPYTDSHHNSDSYSNLNFCLKLLVIYLCNCLRIKPELQLVHQ